MQYYSNIHQKQSRNEPNSKFQFVPNRFNKSNSLHESAKRREREREKKEHDILELGFTGCVAIRRVRARRRRKEERRNESNSTMASTCFAHRNPFFFPPSLQRVAAMSDKNEQV